MKKIKPCHAPGEFSVYGVHCVEGSALERVVQPVKDHPTLLHRVNQIFDTPDCNFAMKTSLETAEEEKSASSHRRTLPRPARNSVHRADAGMVPVAFPVRVQDCCGRCGNASGSESNTTHEKIQNRVRLMGFGGFIRRWLQHQ
jgi:hypothetical protein